MTERVTSQLDWSALSAETVETLRMIAPATSLGYSSVASIAKTIRVPESRLASRIRRARDEIAALVDL